MSELKQQILDEITKKSGVQVVLDSSVFKSLLIRHGYAAQAERANGAYEKRRDTVYMNLDVATPYGFSTLLHELAHATYKQVRLNRSDAILAIEEGTAELTSLLLMQYFGLNTEETDSKSQRYLDSWATDMDYNHAAVKQQAEAAKNYILKNWLPDTVQTFENRLKAA